MENGYTLNLPIAHWSWDCSVIILYKITVLWVLHSQNVINKSITHYKYLNLSGWDECGRHEEMTSTFFLHARRISQSRKAGLYSCLTSQIWIDIIIIKKLIVSANGLNVGKNRSQFIIFTNTFQFIIDHADSLKAISLSALAAKYWVTFLLALNFCRRIKHSIHVAYLLEWDLKWLLVKKKTMINAYPQLTLMFYSISPYEAPQYYQSLLCCTTVFL